MKNGKLVATLGAVALVAAVGLGSTLAYLTAETKTVTNTFEMGNVSFDKSLDNGLLEHEVVSETGKFKENAKWVIGNEYTKVVPGRELDKDPTAFIDPKSEDGWLFVRVSKSADYENIKFNDTFKVLNNETVDADGYWDLELKAVAEAGKNYQVFKSVIVADHESDDVTLDDITIKAALIQREGVDEATAYSEAKGLLAPKAPAVPVEPADNN